MKTHLCYSLALLALTASQTSAQSLYTPYTFTTLAGLAGSAGSADGTGSEARFWAPSGVAVDSSGNVYVADMANYTIRKLAPEGVVTTLAGLAGTAGSTDGTGKAGRFLEPHGLAVDSKGNIYVADTGNATIRKVTPTGAVTTLAGLTGSFGSVDGTGSTARFHHAVGVAVDDASNVYVADEYVQTIRKVTPAGMVTTLAGLAGSSGSADGTGNEARFKEPTGVAVDGAGNIYVADTGNSTIRKVTPAGMVTTLAGLAGSSGSADGTGNEARFNFPTGVAVDTTGQVYVTDTWNNMIRKVTPAGMVTTLAGLPGTMGSADGTGNVVQFSIPRGVAVDSIGNVYVADQPNNTIRKGFGADTVQFARQVYGVIENAGFASILATLGRSYTNLVTVDYSTSDGTAVAGQDYAATNGTITFLPGETTATIMVSSVNDSLVEGPETVNLALSKPTGGVLLGVSSNAVLTITDNDFFTLDSPSDVSENDGSVTIAVIRNGDTGTPLTVAYYTSDGSPPDPGCLECTRSAAAGVDYLPRSGILTFATGETNKTFTIPVLDNWRVDHDRVFTVTLIDESSFLNRVQISINNNEIPAVIDFGFDPGSFVSGKVYALAVQADGKILIGGSFYTVGDVGRTNVARLNADGSLDANFAANTSVTNIVGDVSQVSAVALHTNGKIVISGTFTAVNGINLNGLARLNANGSLDTNFNSFAGITLTSQVPDQIGLPVTATLKALATQPDGKVIIGGTFDTVNSLGRTNLARLNADGSLDTTFVACTELTHYLFPFWDPSNQITVSAEVNTLALQPDGTILVGGTFTTVNGTDHPSIVRLKTDGSLDDGFFVGDGVRNGDNPGTVTTISVLPGGTIFIAGQFTSVHGLDRNNLARLNSDGSLDPSFTPRPTAAYRYYTGVSAAAVEADGGVWVAQSYHHREGGSYYSLSRLNPDGSSDDRIPMVSAEGRINIMATQPDGNVLFGGQSWINNAFGSFALPNINRLYGNPSQPRVEFIYVPDPNTGLYSADIPVRENGGVATITVRRLGETSNALTVDYATTNGTAVAGVNYLTTNGTLSFARLEVTKTINIPILDDYLITSDPQFRVTLSHPTGGGLGLSILAVTIQNADFGFPTGGILRQADGQINLSLAAPDFTPFVLQASTNLVDWVSLATNALNFTDTNAPRFSRRFYRAVH